MGGADRNLIGFSNGVFDTRTGNFREHNKNDWLLNASELPFSPPAEGETLATHAPNFWKWLRRSVADNDRKADRVLAALFMVLANRYDWQLFLEVTGPGGSGKSVTTLASYAQCPRYYRALIAGGVRYDLKCQPCGEVTPQEQQDAETRLVALNEKRKRQRRAAKEKTGA